MAFRSRELSVLAYANGFTLWHYRTEDPATALLDPPGAPATGGGYFDPAAELLRPGDRIMVNLASGSHLAMLDLLVTGARVDGGVTVALAAPTPLPGKDAGSGPGETLAA